MKAKPEALNLSPETLLTFLDDDEQSDLLTALNLESVEGLKNFSASHVLLTIANLRSPFILMMRDISTIVSAFEAFIKGNIQAIVLPYQGQEMRIDFGPQLRGFIVEALDNKLLSDHREAISRRLRECENELNRLFESIQPKGVDRHDRRGELLQDLAEKFDPVNRAESLKYRFIADNVFKHRQMEYNPGDARGIRKLSAKVADMYALASKTDEPSLPDEGTAKIIRAIRQLKTITANKARAVAARVSEEHPTAPRSATDRDFLKCEQSIEALHEAIVALSRQKEALDEVLDFMKLEVWRQRWRIYELWLLARMILFLVRLGGQLKPLQRLSNGTWTLKFTKDETAAAQLTLAGVDVNVYYQFYRTASYGGDMPDIAVEVPFHGFILVLDPKHYRQAKPSEFKAVCKRYSESFKPFLSCVSNYFPHKTSIEYVGDDTSRLIIYDVAPGTNGLVALEDAYSQAIQSAWRSWEIPRRSVIVLFDVSSSTSDMRAEMIIDLKRRLNTISVSDQSILVPFSTEPAEQVSISNLSERDFRLPLPSGGTDFNLAFESAFRLANKMLGPCDIWFYSDGTESIDQQALRAGVTDNKVTIRIIDFAQDERASSLSGLNAIPCVSYEYRGYSKLM